MGGAFVSKRTKWRGIWRVKRSSRLSARKSFRSEDLSGLPGVHIKCKRNERLNVPEAMAQAVRDAERFQDGAPTVFHRRNRSGWLVTQRLEDWMEMHKNSHIKKES